VVVVLRQTHVPFFHLLSEERMKNAQIPQPTGLANGRRLEVRFLEVQPVRRH
jgi:hypothetical protein